MPATVSRDNKQDQRGMQLQGVDVSSRNAHQTAKPMYETKRERNQPLQPEMALDTELCSSTFPRKVASVANCLSSLSKVVKEKWRLLQPSLLCMITVRDQPLRLGLYLGR